MFNNEFSAIKKTGKKTIEITVHLVKWIFFAILVIITLVTVIGVFTAGGDFLIQVATLGTGGFWAFFFGYFGWRMGQSLEKYLTGGENEE